MATRYNWQADTDYGTFKRSSHHEYLYCIAREDGWKMFSKTEAAARKEFEYQNRKFPGRVVMVRTYAVP